MYNILGKNCLTVLCPSFTVKYVTQGQQKCIRYWKSCWWNQSCCQSVWWVNYLHTEQMTCLTTCWLVWINPNSNEYFRFRWLCEIELQIRLLQYSCRGNKISTKKSTADVNRWMLQSRNAFTTFVCSFWLKIDNKP